MVISSEVDAVALEGPGGVSPLDLDAKRGVRTDLVVASVTALFATARSSVLSPSIGSSS